MAIIDSIWPLVKSHPWVSLGAAAGVWAAYKSVRKSKIMAAMQTGFPTLDALIPETVSAMDRYGVLSVEFGQRMMAIYHNEHGTAQDVMTPGDLSISFCPSIGPGQICRKFAIIYGLIDPNISFDDYLALGQDPNNESLLIDWAVYVFAAHLSECGGDYDCATAAYNGSGSAAQTYANNANTWRAGVFGA